MEHATPLPTNLSESYARWKATAFVEQADRFRTLVSDGQHPQALVISCCDSRVLSTDMFEAEAGDFFIHRNIASLVPPYMPSGDHQGTSAAIEYATTVLKVPHVIVMGHSQCGGVQGCADMCAGRAPALEEEASFVGRWIEILRPRYDRVAHLEGREQTLVLEQEAVLLSLENLMTFPFVAERVQAGDLQLHGLWTDIEKGDLLVYSPDEGAFQPA